MAQKRIVVTVPRKMDEFLERMVGESGMDRSNLIRMRLLRWMEEERDRSIAERQFSDAASRRRRDQL